MIAKMSKLTLLVYHKEYVDFLQRLRKVGVVHVVEKNSGAVEDPELEKQLQLSARYARAIKKFESLAKETAAAGNITNAIAIMDKADDLAADIERRKVEVQVIEKDIATIEPWGEFSHSKIEHLRSAGYDVRFFVTGKLSGTVRCSCLRRRPLPPEYRWQPHSRRHRRPPDPGQ